MTLGDLIKKYRENHDISMDEFSKMCNLSKGYISMLENNTNPRSNKPIAPTLPTINKIASAMNVDVDSILKALDSSQEINLDTKPEKSMGIGTRLSKLMDINDTNANELARKIGVSPQTIYSIIKRDSKKADIEVLLKIADIFGVTAEYFVNENSSIIPANELYSKKDFEHLNAYCSLDPIGRSHVDAVLQWESDRMKQIEQAPAAIVELQNGSGEKGRFIDYYRSVSAGSGQVIFDDVYADRILLPDLPDYRKAAYAVKVDGRSMEPLYNDGDILLVEPTCEIEIGEIGIFNVDGKAYVKKLGKEKLISLNKGYDDIQLTEDSSCMGRVVGKL